MTLLEQAPPLQAQSLTGDYRLLADFNGAVLAAHPTRLGVQFVTWDWSFDHTGLNQGNYFQENYAGAKQDFAIRAGLISKQQIFNQEQLIEIYRCCSDTLDAGFDLTAEQEKCIRGVQEQIAIAAPDALNRIREQEQHPMEPYVVIDCSSYIANDILSAVALMEADSVLRLANCDLKSIGYLSSQLPLLRELHWDEDKQYKAASNIKPLQAADRIGQVLGSVAFQLPHSRELEEQYLEGTLLNDLSMKDSKAFRREIEKICKEVF